MAAALPSAPPDLGAIAPTRDVMLSVAEELELVRLLGTRIETAICAMAVRSSIDDGIVSELQQLDAILQHVAALRDFTTELAQRCDAGHRIPVSSALERVTLGDVRARLAGGRLEENPNEAWEML